MAAPILIAHRGASYSAPENTLGAFCLAWREGADGVEGDFRLTRDGHVVCLHNASTGAVSGCDLVVAESTLEQLKRLDVGMSFGCRWRGERIPTLADVLSVIPDGKHFYIEIKNGPETVDAVAEVLCASTVSDRIEVTLISFDAEAVFRAKRVLPRLRSLWLTELRMGKVGELLPSVDTVLGVLERTGADGMGCSDHAALGEEYVGALHRHGVELHVWTVDDPVEAARLSRCGVDSITTNRPGYLRRGLETRVR